MRISNGWKFATVASLPIWQTFDCLKFRQTVRCGKPPISATNVVPVHEPVNQAEQHQQGDKSNHDDLLEEIVTGGNRSGVLLVSHAGLGWCQCQLSSAPEQHKRGHVPAFFTCCPGFAIAASVRNVVALVHRAGGFDDKVLAVVLPHTRGNVERGTIDGVQLAAVVLRALAHLAECQADGLLADRLC